MSCYIVDQVHIDTLVQTAFETSDEQRSFMVFYEGRWVTFDHSREGACELGQVLLDANVAAVFDRYSEEQHRTYYYQRPRWYDWTPAELLKALDGYVYQASDWSSWKGSLAEAICREIQKQLIYRLPGYEEADTWEITADSRPLSLS